MSIFSIRFCAFTFHQCVLNQNSRCSPQSITKSINQLWTNKFVTNKRIKSWLVFHWFFFSDFTHSWFQLTIAVKFVSLQPYDRKYLSLKTANTRIFPYRKPQIKNYYQPLAALQNLEPTANRKPCTCSHPPPPPLHPALRIWIPFLISKCANTVKFQGI